MKMVLILAAMFSFASISHAQSSTALKGVGCLNVEMKQEQVLSQFRKWQNSLGPSSSEEKEHNVRVAQSFQQKYFTLRQYQMACACNDKSFWSQSPAQIARTKRATLPNYCRP